MGAILTDQHEDVGQRAGAELPGPDRLDQPQARRRRGREAVELEGEVHRLWPWRPLAILGHPESDRALSQSSARGREPGPQVRRCLLHPREHCPVTLGSPPDIDACSQSGTNPQELAGISLSTF